MPLAPRLATAVGCLGHARFLHRGSDVSDPCRSKCQYFRCDPIASGRDPGGRAAVPRAHPEAALFRELPGAGPVLAPRLLVAFGTDRQRYPNRGSLQKYSGLAPVRERSGGTLWTHWRWNAPRFLRQSLVEWAGQTVVLCPWAKAYYQQMKAKGNEHSAILRALAFKWVRVLWKCWQTRVPYDNARYELQLAKRRSLLAEALAATPTPS